MSFWILNLTRDFSISYPCSLVETSRSGANGKYAKWITQRPDKNRTWFYQDHFARNKWTSVYFLILDVCNSIMYIQKFVDVGRLQGIWQFHFHFHHEGHFSRYTFIDPFSIYLPATHSVLHATLQTQQFEIHKSLSTKPETPRNILGPSISKLHGWEWFSPGYSSFTYSYS